jgi:hypothetical protein
MGGKPGFVVSLGEWQVKHIKMPFVRYSPRLILWCVASNFTSLSGRVLVARRIVLLSSASVAHLDKEKTTAEKMKMREDAFARVVMAVCFGMIVK